MFDALFYNPIYNLFVFLLDNLTSDAGIVIIAVTIIIKIILFPLAKQAIKTQVNMKKIKPELDALQVKYNKGKNLKPEQRQAMATEMMALYKDNGVRPFASFFIILIQLPVLFALYWVFNKGGLPTIDPAILYSFIPMPEQVNMMFLNTFDLTVRSIPLALLAGASQALHSYIAIDVPEAAPKNADGTTDMKADFARSFTMQMKYGLPLLITFIAWSFRTEEHTSEIQSHHDLVCSLLLEKKKSNRQRNKDGQRRK